MTDNAKVFRVNPEFLVPFNDAPQFIIGTVSVSEDDKLVVSGDARYQLENWYNIGVRTRPLKAHSFAFSVKATPKTHLGAYSIGIIGTQRINNVAVPSINISHFLCSSIRLHKEELGIDFFSGFGRENKGHRTQIGERAESQPIGNTFQLMVMYDAETQLLSCFVSDFPMLHIRAILGDFQLEIRFETVGVAGNFEVEFGDLCYYALDNQQPANVQELTGHLIERDFAPRQLVNREREPFAVPRKIQVPASQEPKTAGVEIDKPNAKKLPDSISILFLAADPTDSARIRQGEELREIQEKLKQSKQRARFEIYQQMSARPADISQAMLDVQPQIVHFSGHGSTSGSLSFESIMGTTQPVEPAALAELFKQFATQVICVVLNACHSDMQASAIAEHVEYVIGMNQAISDQAAIAFAIGFYQALGAGRSIEDAYKLGCTQIRLQGFPEHLTPVLIKKGQMSQ